MCGHLAYTKTREAPNLDSAKRDSVGIRRAGGSCSVPAHAFVVFLLVERPSARWPESAMWSWPRWPEEAKSQVATARHDQASDEERGKTP